MIGRPRRQGRLLAAIGVLTLLGACTTPLNFSWPSGPQRPQLYYISTPFNEAEFAHYDGRGRSSISGQAFVRVPGSLIEAAGSEVVVVPDTSYTRELWRPARSGRYTRVANFDPRYFKYRRAVIADGNGNFRFTGLPAGDYIVQTNVYIPAEGRTVFLHRRVTVEESAAANIILSDLNQQ
ncbi:MAG: hypothetical protein HKM95_00365 [Inquilinus sp.]|nr:hypothetical protein [Inquilinus sp.]